MSPNGSVWLSMWIMTAFGVRIGLRCIDEIYSLYALNQLDTYRYSVSSAGAGGMVQMIPWAYNLMRQRHPGAGLMPDFVAGMRNHANALQAMLLYMQDTWNDLAANEDVQYALSAKLATQPELLAAGYNSNAARLPVYIRRGGGSWRYLIPRETQIYLQIYKNLEAVLPRKPLTTPMNRPIITRPERPKARDSIARKAKRRPWINGPSHSFPAPARYLLSNFLNQV